MELDLHPKQTIVAQSPANEILFGGSAGPGKSFCIRALAIMWCVAIPGLQVYLFRRTFPDLIKNHMKGPTSFPSLLADWVAQKIVKINYSDNEIKFNNGSAIFLCHCQYESSLTKYQGAEIHVLLIDELTHFTDEMYRFLRGRLRKVGIDVPEALQGLFPRIVCASNPGGIGHNWVKKTFIDSAPSFECHRTAPSEGGMLRQFIPALLVDNPSMTLDDPEYADRLRGLGNAELVKAMLNGLWDILAGGMFDDIWRRDIHAIKPFEIPVHWYCDRSFDWGSSKPFSVQWWAESDGERAPNGVIYPRGTLFLFREWYGCVEGSENKGLMLTAKDIALGIIERESHMAQKIHPGACDPSIYSSQNAMCIADDMAAAGVEWVPAKVGAGSRVDGWERMRQLFKASRDNPKEDAGLYIFDTCIQFIRTVPSMPRDERNPEDVDCFVAGTKIETRNGEKDIDLINTGEIVKTPVGWRKVTSAHISGLSETVRVTLENGTTLEGTPHHKVFVEGVGMVALKDLNVGCSLTAKISKLAVWENQSSTTESSIIGQTEKYITARTGRYSRKVRQACTGKFGSIITALYQKVITSTTLTTTPTITQLRIWSLWKRRNMSGCTTRSEMRTVRLVEHWLNGAAVRKGRRSLDATLTRCLRTHPSENFRALIVESLLRQSTLRKSTVVGTAKQRIPTNAMQKFVKFVERLFHGRKPLTAQRGLAVISVVGSCVKKPVFNLTVEQAHLFYANGVLVTNTDCEDHCGDCTRYRIRSDNKIVRGRTLRYDTGR